MIYFLITVHVIVCFFLIIVVLLQSGKAADLAGAFGGMGSQTAFGPRGAATVLSKATTFAAILFMLTSITLSILATRTGATGRSVLGGQTAAPAAAPSPVAPVPPPAGAPNVQINPVPVPPAPAATPPGHTNTAPGHK